MLRLAIFLASIWGSAGLAASSVDTTLIQLSNEAEVQKSQLSHLALARREVIKGLPTSYGCYVKLPSRCPAHPHNVEEDQNWRRVTKSDLGDWETDTCFQRKHKWDEFCGTQDVDVVFVPRKGSNMGAQLLSAANRTQPEEEQAEIRDKLLEAASSTSAPETPQEASSTQEILARHPEMQDTTTPSETREMMQARLKAEIRDKLLKEMQASSTPAPETEEQMKVRIRAKLEAREQLLKASSTPAPETPQEMQASSTPAPETYEQMKVRMKAELEAKLRGQLQASSTPAPETPREMQAPSTRAPETEEQMRARIKAEFDAREQLQASSTPPPEAPREVQASSTRAPETYEQMRARIKAEFEAREQLQASSTPPPEVPVLSTPPPETPQEVQDSSHPAPETDEQMKVRIRAELEAKLREQLLKAPTTRAPETEEQMKVRIKAELEALAHAHKAAITPS